MVTSIKIILLLISLNLLQRLNQKIILKCNCDVPEIELEEKVLTDLASLPELFSNDKLPDPSQETNKCYEFLGCLQTIPTLSEPNEPGKLATSFRIFKQQTIIDIEFKPVKICLKGSSVCQTYPYDLELLIKSEFDSRKRTIIVTPGYRSSSYTKWQEEIKDKWLQLEDVNVILVGWDGGNKGMYDTAAANTRLVARQIAVLLYYFASLNQLSLSDESFSEKMQLVGHSLGAHISGFVGQDLGGLVGRITGLDPAGPQFRNADRRFRLDKSDGQLVDALHTNGCPLSVAEPCYGTEEPVGHLDFFANDGKHQPQCNGVDAFGCSHKASIDYYINFLQHELYMRLYLDKRNHDFYRLFAISGQNYEDIHRGLSLSRLCPVTSLDDYDLHSEDIQKCIVPIDFIGWFGKLKKEYSERYDIDFDPDAKSETFHYFYTSPAFPYINNHNLIKIRVSKEAQKSSSDYSTTMQPSGKLDNLVCDLILHVKMAGGAWMKNNFKNYQLLDEGDHFEVILPYISTDTASKYELARLDANDFYLNESEHLRLISGIKTAFPKSIELIGLKVDDTKEKKGGFLDTIKNFFGLTRGGNQDNESNDLQKFHECTLKVDSISIQPLKKIHRHFVATYSLDGQTLSDPQVIVLGQNETSPKIDLLHGRTSISSATENFNKTKSETFIDTVIIGPRDERFDPIEPDISPDQDDYATGEIAQGAVSSESGVVIWLALTLITICLIVIVIGLVHVMGIRLKRRTSQDRNMLIVEDQSIIVDNP